MTTEQAALTDAESAAPTTPGTGTGTVVTFYSYKGGTGRTMALANLGWILASQGLRVLVVDWDLEAPGLHRYYHPLLVDPELHATDGLIDLLRAYVDQALPGADGVPGAGPGEWLAAPGRLDGYLCGLALDLPAGGRLDLMPAGRQNAAYSAAVTSFNWRTFYTRRDIRGAEFLAILREQWTGSYDYVLIDSRTGVSDTSGICTVLMPDTVVDCFTLGAQSIRGGVDAARAIVDADERDIRVLPVPMRVEDAERAGLAAGRDLAHDAFAPYLDRWLGPERRAEYWRDVEVPYKPFYAYEEVPATVVDRPQQDRSLLGAFERLAGWLTDGRVRALRPVPDRARRRLYAAYLRTGRTRSRQVCVSYAPGERIWAEWAAAVLAGFGYLATLHSAGAPLEPGPPDRAPLPEAAGPLDGDGRVLVLLSPEYAALPRGRELWRRLAAAGEEPGSGALLAVRLTGPAGPLPAPFAGHRAVELARGPAAAAENQLFELIGPPPGAGRWLETGEEATVVPARFPVARPVLCELPPQLAAFTGRDGLLEALRDGLTTGPAVEPVQVLYGMGGVGKSQTAVEYAYRFAPGYDVVWWVPAEDPAGIPQRLAELAPGLGLENDGDVVRSAHAVLDALGRGRPHRRWLLIFDNAGDPEQLAPWLTAAGADGHVLVTSRDRRWARHRGRTEVDVFDRAESVRLVRHVNTGATRAEAERIAELLGDLPLAVGQAAAWLQETPMPASTYADLLDEALTEILDRPVPAGTGEQPGSGEPGGQGTEDRFRPNVTAATWRIAGRDLRRINAPAARLLEVCGFLGPDAIPIGLLYSAPVAEVIGLPPGGSDDRIAVGEILRTVDQFNLARYDRAAGTLGVHRIVQALLRDQVVEVDRERVRSAARSALALADPADPDDPATWSRYAELLPHLRPSGASDSTDPAVRQWIVHTVRYLWHRSLHTVGRDLAEHTLARWRDAAGPGVEDDLTTLRLRVQLGNIQRSLGVVRDAYETDRDVLVRLRAALGPDHPYTVAAAGSLGGDLRHLGRYREARELDRETLATGLRVLGPDHPRTMMAANNLAVSTLLDGDVAEALDRLAQSHQREYEVLGPRSRYTLNAAATHGRMLREAGRFPAALELLEAAVAECREAFGEEHDDTLRARRYLGATLRRLGRYREALDNDEDVHRRLLRRNGAGHPDTAAAAGNLAAALGALGEFGRAVPLAEEAHLHHLDRLGPAHPTTATTGGNLAVLLRRAGRSEEARRLSGAALATLRAALGDRHPYVGLALVNHAHDSALAGDRAAALALAEEAHGLLSGRLGPDHPDALAAAGCLALALAAAGAGERAAVTAERALGLARQALGQDHPVTRALAAGDRLDGEVEPPPV
ncbi:FxSxx-COOH system tetratricopeptide repeat protein [Streptomyces sp. BE20]|uniref:FxSxx-COOH system tetratricopeptide repeat protein n=1 Tax=Streptomyces sp. BE20 TaxID=3002525 RepID=UPI002E77E768|nr:FxSxx-COOH system tetratricopeptide repeat protein [Streptomyces sp. BE20]MEE1827073.1 FxSxx-COOH system tetratricopeptide repeat protein [Streptomyces sp. BE20]